jgi:predicted glycosyl hydrolase (DUF1957 family)
MKTKEENMTMTKFAIDENLLNNAVKIAGVENPSILMQMLLNEYVNMRTPLLLERTEKKTNKKLSERLSGSISKEDYEIMKKELEEMRNEWERNIY